MGCEGVWLWRGVGVERKAEKWGGEDACGEWRMKRPVGGVREVDIDWEELSTAAEPSPALYSRAGGGAALCWWWCRRSGHTEAGELDMAHTPRCSPHLHSDEAGDSGGRDEGHREGENGVPPRCKVMAIHWW